MELDLLKHHHYTVQSGLRIMDILGHSLFLWTVILTLLGTPSHSLPLPESQPHPHSVTTPPEFQELQTEQKQVYIEDEGCQITVWDTTLRPRGVHQVNGRCREGRVSWRNPYGAVRITFGGTGRFSDGIESCFIAKSNFTSVKISLEKEDALKDSPNPLETLVTINSDNSQLDSEVCLRTSQDSVTLYLEADSDLNSYTIGHLEIEYSLDVLEKSTPSSQDSEEDCRPCTEKELLTAVCTKDFAVAGRMQSVEEGKTSSDSIIYLSVENIYRQIENHFTAKSDQITELHNHSFHWQDNSANTLNRRYADTISVPKKCGVHNGEGVFLFLGRFRLGKAILQCAPRLEDFTKMWERALNRKTNPCTLKWNL